MRCNAAEALGRIGDVRAVEPLLIALKESITDVRNISAEALGKIGDARAIEPLITALDDNSWNVRSAAARALVSMYQGHKLDHQANQQVLALRTEIVKSHRDVENCGDHGDKGIGVDFPL
jgi:HEAT repeat protein